MLLHKTGLFICLLSHSSGRGLKNHPGTRHRTQTNSSASLEASDAIESLRSLFLASNLALGLRKPAGLLGEGKIHESKLLNRVNARVATTRLVDTATLSETSEVSDQGVYTPLAGNMLTRVSDGKQVDLGQELAGPGIKLCILGTYPADFNMIEYLQHLAYYLPKLKERGISKFLCTINGSPSSAKLLSELLELPDEIELLSDVSGAAGVAFGVGRGWLPDQDELAIGDFKLPISPYVKLFGMLLGLGARDTLPSVITGYIGNPWGTNGWIQSALAQGQRAGRWPDTVLDLDESGTIRTNKFDELPVVGSWGRRPLELATLRLQTMVGLSIAKWSDLQPADEKCLTQLGGLLVVDGDQNPVYEWRDNGICNVADFEKVLQALTAL